MKKQPVILVASCILFLAACNSNDSKTATTTTDTTAVTQTMDIEDPDPTDSIPANEYGVNTYGKATTELVTKKLQDMFASETIEDASRRFIFFEYDLNDDGQKEIFVGLTGPFFCGSGGCTILLLNSIGDLLTKFTVSETPVIIADTKTKEWKDLMIYSAGKNHLMHYNGTTYPSNPSVEPVEAATPGDSLPRALDFLSNPYPWFKF